MNYKAIFAWAMALALLIPGVILAEEHDAEFTDTFPLEACKFKSKGKNPLFPLEPGHQLYLNNASCVEEEECEEFEEVWVTVLHETHKVTFEIDGEMKTVKTRIVEELEMTDGELDEISRNFFAECKGSHDVYYFGEDVDIYEDGEIVSHDGEWEAGVDDALPGLIMPGTFLLGSRYFQELAPEVGLDRGENIAMGLEVEVPAGTFEDCVEIEDTNALEPEEDPDPKIYCPGIGIVMDEDLELVEITEVDD